MPTAATKKGKLRGMELTTGKGAKKKAPEADGRFGFQWAKHPGPENPEQSAPTDRVRVRPIDLRSHTSVCTRPEAKVVWVSPHR